MATEILSRARTIDRAYNLITMADGVLGVVRSASLSPDTCGDEDIANTCITVQDILKQLRDVVTQLTVGVTGDR